MDMAYYLAPHFKTTPTDVCFIPYYISFAFDTCKKDRIDNRTLENIKYKETATYLPYNILFWRVCKTNWKRQSTRVVNIINNIGHRISVENS